MKQFFFFFISLSITILSCNVLFAFEDDFDIERGKLEISNETSLKPLEKEKIPPVPQLLKDLSNFDENTKSKAILYLGLKEHTAVRKRIKKLYKETENVSIKTAAASSLIIFEPKLRDKLLPYLLDVATKIEYDYPDKLFAIKSLCIVMRKIKDRMLFRYLLRFLNRSDFEEIRLLIIKQLSFIDDKYYRRILLNYLTKIIYEDKSDKVRTVALQVLTSNSDETKLDFVLPLLEHRYSDIRMIAVRTLSNVITPQVITKMFLVSVKDKDRGIKRVARENAFKMFERLYDSRIKIGTILEVLRLTNKYRDKKLIVNLQKKILEIVKHLPEADKTDCITPLVAALRSKIPYVRSIGALGLGHIGNTKVIRILRQYYKKERNKYAKASIKKALKLLGFF